MLLRTGTSGRPRSHRVHPLVASGPLQAWAMREDRFLPTLETRPAPERNSCHARAAASLRGILVLFRCRTSPDATIRAPAHRYARPPPLHLLPPLLTYAQNRALGRKSLAPLVDEIPVSMTNRTNLAVKI